MQDSLTSANDPWPMVPAGAALHACTDAIMLIAREKRVPIRLLTHRSRCRATTARARQLAMYLSHVILGRSLTEIGDAFGRDRTTVSYACALIEDMRDDPVFDEEVSTLERQLEAQREGPLIMPIDDNVLLRLATGRTGEEQAFLLPHHLLAANRLERLIERARLLPRVTMSYDPGRVGGGAQAGNGAADASDSAANARQKLNGLAMTIPWDCWGVMLDVCGFGKGLQAIEMERRWPRRSAKLVLRIGLEQLALLFGLAPQATGADQALTRAWLPERLPIVPDIQP